MINDYFKENVSINENFYFIVVQLIVDFVFPILYRHPGIFSCWLLRTYAA